MTRFRTNTGWRSAMRAMRVGAVGLCVLASVPVADAQSTDDGSATERLIQILIAKGVLTQEQAASLLTQAREESHAQHKLRAKPRAAQMSQTAAPVQQAPQPPPPPIAPNTVRVTYVPQIVREQIASEVRQQVMQQARDEGWAAPGAAAEWTKRVRVYGDLRMRGERSFESSSNGPLVDFNSINSGGGFDTTLGGGLPPTINTLEDRTRFRVRARIGVHADIVDWASADIRIATGNDYSPVSTNQTLGQGGNFSKYAIWLDRAYIRLQPLQPAAPNRTLDVYLGRQANPFWTTDLAYYDDLSFDGAAVAGSYALNHVIDVFGSAGAFTLFNTDFNFSSVNETKFPSHDKYLFAGQAGVVVKPSPSLTGKFAAGFFAYTDVDGKVSDPCTILQTGYGCNTDASRAQFLQTGNTLFPIRNIIATGTSAATPQYFGLASRFDVLDLHGRVDYIGLGEPVAVEGEFAKNLGFNKSLVANRGPSNNTAGASNTFVGGDTAYLVKLTVGKTDVAELWDWNTFVVYKYLESDSVLDALTDPNFHLGGTNAKGFILGGNLGLARNLYIAARWYSASQVSGVPYANDLVQVDLNARF